MVNIFKNICQSFKDRMNKEDVDQMTFDGDILLDDAYCLMFPIRAGSGPGWTGEA